MDFDLRQWLLILGPVFIVGVLLHGYIRMRAGQNEIRMKLDKDFLSNAGEEPNLDDLNLLKAELPNGGARVINANGEVEDQVPVLMEPVDVPSVSAVDEPVIPAPEPPKAPPARKAPAARAQDNSPEPIDSPERENSPEPINSPEREDSPEPISSPEREDSPEPISSPEREDSPEPISSPEREDSPEPINSPEPSTNTPEPKPEKFVVVHVLALDTHFSGQALVELLVDAGMTFGEMDIFHKLDHAGEPQFSLASAVEPGTFDMTMIDQFSTPGVTLFMRVHELSDPVTVLDEMLAVADAIVLELGGELRDETRSVMTPQTIEHCRQSVQEFQFKYSA